MICVHKAQNMKISKKRRSKIDCFLPFFPQKLVKFEKMKKNSNGVLHLIFEKKIKFPKIFFDETYMYSGGWEKILWPGASWPAIYGILKNDVAEKWTIFQFFFRKFKIKFFSVIQIFSKFIFKNFRVL